MPRRKSISGVIDPVSLIGVLFLIITLSVGTHVVADKKYDFNIFEEAAKPKKTGNSAFDKCREESGREVCNERLGINVNWKGEIVNEIDTSNVPQDYVGKTCDANGTQHTEGSKVIGGNGSGYSKCESGRWVDCPECTVTSLTTVPVYKQEEYNLAVEAEKQAVIEQAIEPEEIERIQEVIEQEQKTQAAIQTQPTVTAVTSQQVGQPCTNCHTTPTLTTPSNTTNKINNTQITEQNLSIANVLFRNQTNQDNFENYVKENGVPKQSQESKNQDAVKMLKIVGAEALIAIPLVMVGTTISAVGLPVAGLMAMNTIAAATPTISALTVGGLTIGAVDCAINGGDSKFCKTAGDLAIMAYTGDPSGFTQMFNQGLTVWSDTASVVSKIRRIPVLPNQAVSELSSGDDILNMVWDDVTQKFVMEGNNISKAIVQQQSALTTFENVANEANSTNQMLFAPANQNFLSQVIPETGGGITMNQIIGPNSITNDLLNAMAPYAPIGNPIPTTLDTASVNPLANVSRENFEPKVFDVTGNNMPKATEITIPQKFTNWAKAEMAKTNPNAFLNGPVGDFVFGKPIVENAGISNLEKIDIVPQKPINKVSELTATEIENEIRSRITIASDYVELGGPGAGSDGNTYDDLLKIVKRKIKNGDDPITAVTRTIYEYHPKNYSQISPDELAYKLDDPTAISSKLTCGVKLNCLELPILEKQLFTDLGIDSEVIVSTGGTKGLPDYTYRHGALKVGDQVIGYYAPYPLDVERFSRVAERMKWGNFEISDNLPKVELVKPGFFEKLQERLYMFWSEEVSSLLPKIPKSAVAPKITKPVGDLALEQARDRLALRYAKEISGGEDIPLDVAKILYNGENYKWESQMGSLENSAVTTTINTKDIYSIDSDNFPWNGDQNHMSIQEARELYKSGNFDPAKSNKDPIKGYQLTNGEVHIIAGRHRATAALLENQTEIPIELYKLKNQADISTVSNVIVTEPPTINPLALTWNAYVVRPANAVADFGIDTWDGVKTWAKAEMAKTNPNAFKNIGQDITTNLKQSSFLAKVQTGIQDSWNTVIDYPQYLTDRSEILKRLSENLTPEDYRNNKPFIEELIKAGERSQVTAPNEIEIIINSLDQHPENSQVILTYLQKLDKVNLVGSSALPHVLTPSLLDRPPADLAKKLDSYIETTQTVLTYNPKFKKANLINFDSNLLTTELLDKLSDLSPADLAKKLDSYIETATTLSPLRDDPNFNDPFFFNGIVISASDHFESAQILKILINSLPKLKDANLNTLFLYYDTWKSPTDLIKSLNDSFKTATILSPLKDKPYFSDLVRSQQNLYATWARSNPQIYRDKYLDILPTWLKDQSTNLNDIQYFLDSINKAPPDLGPKLIDIYVPTLLKNGGNIKSVTQFANMLQDKPDPTGIAQILDLIPNRQWVPFLKNYDIYNSQISIPDYFNIIKTTSGNEQRIAINNFVTELQRIDADYNSTIVQLLDGVNPTSVDKYAYIDNYLKSIDENYTKSYADLAEKFGITDWKNKTHAQVLAEISPQIPTVPLKPAKVTFNFRTQDTLYSAPESLMDSLRTGLEPSQGTTAEDISAAIKTISDQYSKISDTTLNELINNGVNSTEKNQLLSIIPEANRVTAGAKIDGILKSNLPQDMKLQNIRNVVLASMQTTGNEVSLVIRELFIKTDAETLLDGFVKGTLSPEDTSIFLNHLSELQTNALPDLIQEYPGLSGFDKTLESTDLWKNIKQINAQKIVAEQVAKSNVKEITLSLTNKNLIDVWQGNVSGTCFGNCPAFLSQRLNIVPVKMLKDGDIFGNALFIIQPDKFILVGFDPSVSFASAVTKEKMDQFVDLSMQGFQKIADENGLKFMIGIPDEVGGLSNRTEAEIESYITQKYLPGSKIVPIQPESKLHPIYGPYEPKNAYQLDPKVTSDLRNPPTLSVAQTTATTSERPSILTQVQDWWKANIVDEQGFLPPVRRFLNPVPTQKLTTDEVTNLINNTNGPIIEVGGPTPGYKQVYIPELNRNIYVSNIETGTPVIENGVQIGSTVNGRVDLLTDSTKLPFADNSVGAIFGSALEEQTIPQTLSEAYRTLKPDGVLVLQNAKSIENQAYAGIIAEAEKLGFKPLSNIEIYRFPGKSDNVLRDLVFQKTENITPSPPLTGFAKVQEQAGTVVKAVFSPLKYVAGGIVSAAFLDNYFDWGIIDYIETKISNLIPKKQIDGVEMQGKIIFGNNQVEEPTTSEFTPDQGLKIDTVVKINDCVNKDILNNSIVGGNTEIRYDSTFKPNVVVINDKINGAKFDLWTPAELVPEAITPVQEWVNWVNGQGYTPLISSAYRSYETQQAYNSSYGFQAASPGGSCHQSGLCFDVHNYINNETGERFELCEDPNIPSCAININAQKKAAELGIAHPYKWDQPHYMVAVAASPAILPFIQNQPTNITYIDSLNNQLLKIKDQCQSVGITNK